MNFINSSPLFLRIRIAISIACILAATGYIIYTLKWDPRITMRELLLCMVCLFALIREEIRLRIYWKDLSK